MTRITIFGGNDSTWREVVSRLRGASIDAVHNDPNALLLSYNDTAGHARIGIWSATTGQFVEDDLASSTISFNGNLNCSDTKLAYLGAANSSGIQVWYIKDLTTGLTSKFLRDSNIFLQYWSC